MFRNKHLFLESSYKKAILKVNSIANNLTIPATEYRAILALVRDMVDIVIITGLQDSYLRLKIPVMIFHAGGDIYECYVVTPPLLNGGEFCPRRRIDLWALQI